MNAGKRMVLCAVLIPFGDTLWPVVYAGQTAQKSPGTKMPAPTVAEAEKFVSETEQKLFELGNKAQRAAWVQENFITDDTEQINAEAGEAAKTNKTERPKGGHR